MFWAAPVAGTLDEVAVTDGWQVGYACVVRLTVEVLLSLLVRANDSHSGALPDG
jgi:hypothetical protein